MSEAVEIKKKTKPSAGTKVTFKVAQYVPGMEKDPEFEGVSFARAIPPGMKAAGDQKPINGLRQGLMADKCKAYGVKPLGAASAPAGGITAKVKAWVEAVATAQKEAGQKIDAAIIIRLTKTKHGTELTPEQVKEILVEAKMVK
jgi:hypothetical protein